MASWDDGQVFCQWLTTHEQAAGRLPADWHYRLPSDHEWSCAVGIGDRENPSQQPAEKNGKIANVFPWGTPWPPPKGAGNFAGEEFQPALARGNIPYAKEVIPGYNDGFVFTSPVESFAANQFGLFDMGGNVQQWCEDWNNQNQTQRVLRGSSWFFYAPSPRMTAAFYFVQSSYRGSSQPVTHFNGYGFRCVLSPSSSSAVTTSLPTSPASAGWISLMDRIDPAADTVRGVWTRVANELQGAHKENTHGPAVLQLPYEPPQEYDFRIAFTASGAGVEATQILSSLGHQFSWATSNGQIEKWSGFSRVDGKDISNSPAAVKLVTHLQPNQRYESLVEVRRGRVTGYIDGKKIVDWPTEYHEMQADGDYILPNQQTLGIGIWWATTTFHDISVREVTGKGKFLREASAPSSPGVTPQTAAKDAPFVNSLGMKFVPVPITSGPTNGRRVLFSVWDTRVQELRGICTRSTLSMARGGRARRDGVPVGRGARISRGWSELG